MRLAPLDNISSTLLNFATSSDVKQFPLGMLVRACGTDYDTTSGVANWGMAELMYVSNVSIAIPNGTVCGYDKNWRALATLSAASVANSVLSVGVAVTNFSAGSTTEQYGWLMRRGVCPAKFSVAATAGVVYTGTAGLCTPTATAGGQILGARTTIAAVTTFTRAGTTKTGSSNVRFANVAGMYPGQAISGTGIPASSVISAIDSSGTNIVIGSAIGTPVAATATGTVTATMTNTGYGILSIEYPFIQGQIT